MSRNAEDLFLFLLLAAIFCGLISPRESSLPVDRPAVSSDAAGLVFQAIREAF